MLWSWPPKPTPPDPHARVAVQTERDPVDRAIEEDKIKVLARVAWHLGEQNGLLASIDQSLGNIVKLLTPPRASRITAVVTDIPRTEP